MKIDNQQEIMNRFAEQRVKFGTQEKLAEEVGVSTKSISDFETCRRNPSFATFIKMCRVIDADINYIMYGNKHDESTGKGKIL